MAGLMEWMGAGQDLVERNMKQVGPAMKEVHGWRVPNPALEGPKVAEKAAQVATKGGGGLLRMLGGPAALGVQAAVMPGELANGELRTEEEAAKEWTSANPAAAMSAARYGKDLSDRLVKSSIDQWRAAKPPTPLGAPETPEPPKEQIQAQIESQRQTIQLGALKGLETGEVSRPKLAEAIVQADAQRADKTMTPEQSKQAVQTEMMAMKTMDNNDLSRYVSYALVAGGVLASFLDKSGKAGDMFSDSFNRQLDRNLQGQKMTAQNQQAAAKLAMEQKKLDVTEKDVDSKVEDRTATRELTNKKVTGLLGKWDNDAAVDQAKLRQGAAGLGLQSQRLNLDLHNANIKNAQGDRKLTQGDRLLDIREKAAAAKAQGSAPKGVPLSFKDNSDVVKSYADASGQKMTPSVQKAVASRMGTIQKNYPDLSIEQQYQIAIDELAGSTETKNTGGLMGIFGMGDPETSFIK